MCSEIEVEDWLSSVTSEWQHWPMQTALEDSRQQRFLVVPGHEIVGSCHDLPREQASSPQFSHTLCSSLCHPRLHMIAATQHKPITNKLHPTYNLSSLCLPIYVILSSSINHQLQEVASKLFTCFQKEIHKQFTYEMQNQKQENTIENTIEMIIYLEEVVGGPVQANIGQLLQCLHIPSVSITCPPTVQPHPHSYICLSPTTLS